MLCKRGQGSVTGARISPYAPFRSLSLPFAPRPSLEQKLGSVLFQQKFRAGRKAAMSEGSKVAAIEAHMASGKLFRLSLTNPTGEDRWYHLKFAGDGIKKVCAAVFYLSSCRSDLISCIRSSRTRARAMSPDTSSSKNFKNWNSGSSSYRAAKTR